MGLSGPPSRPQLEPPGQGQLPLLYRPLAGGEQQLEQGTPVPPTLPCYSPHTWPGGQCQPPPYYITFTPPLELWLKDTFAGCARLPPCPAPPRVLHGRGAGKGGARFWAADSRVSPVRFPEGILPARG